MVYHAWREEATAVSRLAMLNKHISEVGASMAASISSDGRSRNPGNLNEYYSMLLGEAKRLEAEIGARGSSRVAFADFSGGSPR